MGEDAQPARLLFRSGPSGPARPVRPVHRRPGAADPEEVVPRMPQPGPVDAGRQPSAALAADRALAADGALSAVTDPVADPVPTLTAHVAASLPSQDGTARPRTRPRPGPRPRPTPRPRASAESQVTAQPRVIAEPLPAPGDPDRDAHLVEELEDDLAVLEGTGGVPHVDRGEVWELVRRVQNGDAEAFGEIYDRYVTMVHRF